MKTKLTLPRRVGEFIECMYRVNETKAEVMVVDECFEFGS